MNNKRLLTRLFATIATGAIATVASSYVFLLDDTGMVSTWREGTIPMQVKLNNSQILTDGTTQVQSVLAAMQEWNQYLGTVQFVGSGAAPGSYGIWDGTSEIAMDSAINSDGESIPFGEFVLAVTISFEEGNTTSESDIIFNTAYQWDSFRGVPSGDQHDIRRVAAHEMGHVLGLDHPDEAVPQQYGWFLMNSRVSYYPSIEGPQPDDVAGAQSLYGYPGFLPPNDHFASATSVHLVEGGTTAIVHGTNVAATSEPGDPDLDPDDPGGRTVWWKWTATYGGTVTVTTAGSNLDTLLGAYTGTSVDALTQLALNDDVESSVIRHSAITFSVDFGTTYYFAVDGWNGVVGLITLNLTIEPDYAKSPPTFTSPPLTRTVTEGSAIAIPSGIAQESLSNFVWRKDGVVLGSQTGSSLELASAALSDSGLYQVTATNSFGSSHSSFVLSVVPVDATIAAWAETSGGSLEIPATLGPLFAADADESNVVALRADQIVTVWGLPYTGMTSVPEGLSSVVSVTNGGQYALALKSNGTVVVWGDGPYDYHGDDSPIHLPNGLSRVISISSSWTRSMALRTDGTVVTWGAPIGTGQPTGLKDVVAIAAGFAHSLALRADRTVVAWGFNENGESTPPAGLTDVIAISAGGAGSIGGHSLALRADGTVVAWGYNASGQCNVPGGLTDVVAIAAGGNFSLALKSDGSVVGWGENNNGQLDVPSGTGEIVRLGAGSNVGFALIRPVLPSIVTQPLDQAVNEGDTATFIVTASGTYPLTYRWSKNGIWLTDGAGISGAATPRLTIENAQLGSDGTIVAEVSNTGGTAISNPVQLRVGVPSSITARPATKSVVEGQPVSFTVAASGGPFTYAWKHNRRTIEGADSATFSLESASPEDAGYYEALVFNSSGGYATSVFYLHVAVSDPALILFGTAPPPAIDGSISGIDVGGFYLVVKGDGTVVSWAYDAYGSPSVPPGHTDVVAASAGSAHGVLLKSDGTVVGFGLDSAGQASPPSGLSGVVAVSSGSVHNIALRSNGTVVTWGNPHGVDPYRTNPETPSGLRNVVAVRCTRYGYLALRSDGSVVSWGTEHNSPVPEGLADVVDITGDDATLGALRSDGTVVHWGGYEGLIVSDVNDAVRIDGRLALSADGTVVEWLPRHYEPSRIPEGLNGVLAIASETFAGIALTRRGPPVLQLHPADIDAVVGDYLVMTSKATGTIPLNYQWRRDGVNLADGDGVSGSKKPSLIFDSLKAADGGVYDVIVTNSVSSTVSDPAVLTVRVPPVITKRPLTKLAAVGDAVTFEIEYADPASVTIKWRHKGVIIPGATGSSLTIGSVSLGDEGFYTVEVGNADATACSTFALHVAPTSVEGVSLAAWGYQFNDYGVLNVPFGIEDPVEIAVGEEHAVALQGDGTVRAWGLDVWGALNPPAGLTDVVAVAAGEYHSLALRADGRVFSWGGYSTYPAEVPKDLRNVVAIAVDRSANIALRRDGTVVTWGLDPAPGDLGDVVSVVAGYASGFAIRSDGSLASWGPAQTGTAVPPTGIGPVSGVAFGYSHGLALKQDGTVVGWGANSHGEATVPQGLAGVVEVSAGNAHSFALKSDGTLAAWGDPGTNRSGMAPPFGGIAMIRSSYSFNLALTTAKIAPKIVNQPGDLTAYKGGLVFFRATAHGVPAPLLQWQKDGVDIPGESGEYLWVNNVSESARYRVVATNPAGSAVSREAWLNMVTSSSEMVARPVVEPPGQQFTFPLTLTISTGTEGATIRYATGEASASTSNGTVYTGPITITNSTSLSVIAYKEGMLNSDVAYYYYEHNPHNAPKILPQAIPPGVVGMPFQYQLGSRDGDGEPEWSIVSGVFPYGLTLSTDGLITGTPTSAGGFQVYLLVRDSDEDTSPDDQNHEWFTIEIEAENFVPRITSTGVPPAMPGQPYSATLNATAGNGPLVWQLESGSLPLGLDLSAGGVITGTPSGVETADVVISVGDADIITDESDEDSISLRFVVENNSVPAITTAALPDAGLSIAYSWSLAGTGGNGPLTWSLASGSLPPGLTLSEGGLISGIPRTLGTRTFTVRVADDDTITGSGDEAIRELSINVVSAPRLTNVSMRAFAGSGDDTLIVGFNIAGKGQKTVLIRGVGPKLLDYNVPSAVADPRITLYDDDVIIGTNDDWEASLAPVFADAGAFALDADSKDAAMTATLGPGGYTIHLVNSGSVAEALVEVYDISRDAGTRLVNVSSRLRFRPGQLAILGTAVTGGPVSVLARNVGPGLARYLPNGSSVLPDPHVRLYTGQTQIAVNDDWDPALLPFFGAAGAFTIDEGSKDAAIRAQFQAGGYTVHSTGNGGEGVAIIEIYESP